MIQITPDLSKAGIPEAPADSAQYVRKDGGWVQPTATTVEGISDASSAGRTVLTAASTAVQRELLGARYPTLLLPSGKNIFGDIPNNWATSSTSTGVVLGNTVTTIGSNAFQYCTSLTGALTIPSTVTTIGTYAFCNCPGLTSVNARINKSVLDVANSLLGTGVTTVHVRASDATWTAGAGQTIGGKTGITVVKDL